MMGKPCIHGTRIPVYLVLQKMASGETQEEILAAGLKELDLQQQLRAEAAAAAEAGKTSEESPAT